ncbi:MAG: hypothetical protein ACRC8K_17545 [Waterburya sp.]
MNKTVLLILIGALVSLATGCSTSSDVADSQKELEKNAAKPTPVQIDTPTTQANQTEAEESTDLDADKKAEPVQKIAALIPPTNPEVRVRTTVRGRQDPFALVSVTPKIKVEPKEVAKQPITAPTQNRLAEEENISPREVEESFTPPVEAVDPTLAKNVIISGLYEANGTTKLIVQESEESGSRYVDIGERIVDGQVLVKSVNANSSPTPLVILEQSGVQVSKAIGEVPEETNI